MFGKKKIWFVFCLLAALFLCSCGRKKSDTVTITNVSYDPTREFYEQYNKLFEKFYQKKYGKKVEVIQSHGGSGSQAFLHFLMEEAAPQAVKWYHKNLLQQFP